MIVLISEMVTFWFVRCFYFVVDSTLDCVRDFVLLVVLYQKFLTSLNVCKSVKEFFSRCQSDAEINKSIINHQYNPILGIQLKPIQCALFSVALFQF